MADNELDVRQLRKPDKHPTIFAGYAALPIGGSFVLVNNHDPKHLRAEFDIDHPGSFEWEYLEKGPEVWRIRITKLTAVAAKAPPNRMRAKRYHWSRSRPRKPLCGRFDDQSARQSAAALDAWVESGR
jgi:uncharacterized protein (DUF2249 family)